MSGKVRIAQLPLQLGELEKLAAAARPKETITRERAARPVLKHPLPSKPFAHLQVKETVEIIPASVRAD